MNRAILMFSAAILLWLAVAAPLAASDTRNRGASGPALTWDPCSWEQTFNQETISCDGVAET